MKALKRFPEQTPGATAKQFGFSTSYTYEIADELSASGELPVMNKRRGANGKMYAVKMRVEQADVDDSEKSPLIGSDTSNLFIPNLSTFGKSWEKREVIGDCTLFQGDCFEILPVLDVKADAIMSDPPYNCTAHDWDVKIPFEYLWAMVADQTKQAPNIILFGCNKFTIDLAHSNRQWYRYRYAWLKNNMGNWQNPRQPGREYEEILVFGRPGFKEATTYNPIKIPSTQSPTKMICPGDVLRFALDKEEPGIKRHPTQKPLALMEYLVKTYTNVGDLVIDPFSGSGTTAVACTRLGRRCISIEREAEFFDVAVERLKRIMTPTHSDVLSAGLTHQNAEHHILKNEVAKNAG